MLTITIPETEYWSEEKEEFAYKDPIVITLEHSLVSLSKWESEHEKPYINNEANLTTEELLDYIRKMTITKNVAPEEYYRLTEKEISQIREYMNRTHTATVLSQDPNKHGNGKYAPKERITSEMIYYWMFQLNIPMECQRWNLNRLLTLIELCNRNNSPQKKMSKKDLYDRNRQINAINRAKYKSKG